MEENDKGKQEVKSFIAIKWVCVFILLAAAAGLDSRAGIDLSYTTPIIAFAFAVGIALSVVETGIKD